MTAFDRLALDAHFSLYGVAALHDPEGETPRPCKLVFRSPDAPFSGGYGGAETLYDGLTAEVRVNEIAIGVMAPGDVFQSVEGGQLYELVDAPRFDRMDVLRLVHVLRLEPIDPVVPDPEPEAPDPEP